MDSAQYHRDMQEGCDVYECVNLFIRRKPKENNFKAVLETIRDLMNTSAVGQSVPPWLHDVFLGYDDPSKANYQKIEAHLMTTVSESKFT